MLVPRSVSPSPVVPKELNITTICKNNNNKQDLYCRRARRLAMLSRRMRFALASARVPPLVIAVASSVTDVIDNIKAIEPQRLKMEKHSTYTNF